MKTNDVTYKIFCSNCKRVTPHIIESDLESESKIETISPNFLSEFFNFLFNANALNTNHTPYTCSICQTNYLDDY